MKMNLLKILFLVLSPNFVFCCQQNDKEKYLFFLHNGFLEKHELNESHPEYGKTEYLEILDKFRESGINVISELRSDRVNQRDYALKIVKQIDSLLDKGVRPESITVVGTSKGGYIARFNFSIISSEPTTLVSLSAKLTDRSVTKRVRYFLLSNALVVSTLIPNSDSLRFSV